jgi:hypothetical protein
MDKNLKYLLIGLAILIILTPIGLYLGGDTFAEWGAQEVKDKIGYVPSGFSSLSNIWNAPLPDYAVPVFGGSTIGQVSGYIVSAVIGAIVCGGALYLMGKILARKDEN